MREQFEEWLCSRYEWANETLNCACFIGDDDKGYYVDGHYIYDGQSCSDALHWLWEGYKARASE